MGRHDHQLHEGDSLKAAARDRLTGKGEQWTDMRAAVFDALASFDKPASAYDIAEQVSQAQGRRVAANSVYRILDLFVGANLARRVESANAYVANQHPDCLHDCIFLICDTCGQAVHIDDDSADQGRPRGREGRGFLRAAAGDRGPRHVRRLRSIATRPARRHFPERMERSMQVSERIRASLKSAGKPVLDGQPSRIPMSDRPDTPLLDSVQYPADLRALSKEQLPQLADELRQETISAVSVTGGHLGAGLGVVELTVALHYVFDTPDDRLIWDVGHQAYPHKIVTGRRDRIRTLRQGGGLSGFTRRSESEYDPFGAAHSSTSISAALGFAIANKLSGDPGQGGRGDRRRGAAAPAWPMRR